MISRRFLRDADGATAVEFALTSPIYFLGLFGLAQAGVWLWADFSLQRAVDAASRCAAVLTMTCDNTADTQTYAANAATGLPVTANNFTVTAASTLTPNTCGPKSFLVSASYTVPTFVPALPDINVKVSACYPT
jgi:Flp pilus assembly protein TadG